MLLPSCKYFSNKQMEKSNTLKFSEIMIFMQHMQYNAPNCIYAFQKFSRISPPDPLLVLRLRIEPLPLQNSGCTLGNFAITCAHNKSNTLSFAKNNYFCQNGGINTKLHVQFRKQFLR